MDYKHRIPGYSPRPKRKKSRVGLWATLAIVAGLIAAAAGWMLTLQKDEHQTPQQDPPKAANTSPIPLPNPAAKPPDKKPAKAETKGTVKQEQQEKPATVNLPEPRFTFYKILPEKESIIPESEIKNLKQEESLGKKTPSVQYLLQAGSFTNVQDAEKLKARLSSLRIKSHIENVKIENASWNRVKIGPFTTLAAADGVRAILRNNQIDSVVQKSLSTSARATTGR